MSEKMSFLKIFVPIFFFLVSIFMGLNAQAQLPPEAKAKLLDRQIVSAIKSEDLSKDDDLISEYQAIGVSVPATYLFIQAKIADSNGEYLRSRTTLESYFNSVETSHPKYDEALTLYQSVELNIEAEKVTVADIERDKEFSAKWIPPSDAPDVPFYSKTEERKLTGKNQCFSAKLDCFKISASSLELTVNNKCSHGLVISPRFKYYAKKPNSAHFIETSGKLSDLYLKSGESTSVPNDSNRPPVSYSVGYLGTTKEIDEKNIKIRDLCVPNTATGFLFYTETTEVE